MNKNSKTAIQTKKAIFDCSFCNGKYYSPKKHNKCHLFYENNKELEQCNILVCPYGYTCIFGKRSIISSIVDDCNCNLDLIQKRNRYDRRCKLKEEKGTNIIYTKKDIENECGLLKEEFIFSIYQDTFHDLKNNNRYFLDCVDAIKGDLNKIDGFNNLLLSLSNIYNDHLKKHENNDDIYKKKQLYEEEIEEIGEITKNMLSRIPKNRPSVYDNLRSSLDFVDFRIRYFKKIVGNDGIHHINDEKKKINIISILTKLKYAFYNSTNKKNQKIKIENDCDEIDFTVNAYDDLYIAFFILYENAIKYAPLNSLIVIKIRLDKNKYKISIKNKTEGTEDDKGLDLLQRGVRGSNKKDGNGLGLSIAKEIFNSSNLDLSVDNDLHYFVACVDFENTILTI